LTIRSPSEKKTPSTASLHQWVEDTVELCLDCHVGKDLFFAHIDPHFVSDKANAAFLRKLVQGSPAAKRFEIPHPEWDVDYLLVKNNHTHTFSPHEPP
jgi:hypothetical protein